MPSAVRSGGNSACTRSRSPAVSAAGPSPTTAPFEQRHAVGDAADLLEIVRHHQHRRAPLLRDAQRDLLEPTDRRLRRARPPARRGAAARESGSSALREQHAPQLAARQHRQRAVLEPGEAHAGRAAADPLPRGRASPRSRPDAAAAEREELLDRDRQRAIDRERLRHVADRARVRASGAIRPVERDPAEDRREQRALARAVRARRSRGSMPRPTRSDTPRATARAAARNDDPATLERAAAAASRSSLP